MIGRTVSHYRILEELGRGGMGVVYKAEDTKLRRTVALKFLSPQALGTEEEKARFIHEAQAAAALNHPNICTIYEIDELEGQPFIAMEYIEGESLKSMIESGPLKLDKAKKIAIQIAEGLHEAHRRQIVHRDIKPANIMITGEGRVKIMDFGLAKSPSREQLTREGTTLGTVEYMSPEQGQGEAVDSRTDIWSFGVIVYEMVTGRLPFKGEYEQAVIYSIMNEDPEPMTALRTGVPVEMERIAHKAMAKNPKDRYQHADELLVDLRSLSVEKKSTVAVKVPAKKGFTKKQLGLVFSAVIIIAAAIVLAGLHLFPKKGKPIDSIAVLPLENLSNDPDQEYFADGMTEALIADLAKIGSLRVISRTSVMRYKGTRKPLPEIARELHVDAILEGSVLQISGRVRITVQLIEAAFDRHLWAESYESDLQDVLALQNDVARAVASEINITLAPREKGGSTRRIDPRAYEAFLKGRFHWNKRTRWDLEKSIEYFEEAVRIDPDYARAYAAIAEAFAMLRNWGWHESREADKKVKEYVQKALAIDDKSAAAYSVLAFELHEFDYDREAAEEYFKKAISLNPNYETAHQWYALLLSRSGRHDEALEHANRALQLDPLSASINSVLAVVHYNARRFDEAIAQCWKTFELDKDSLLAFLVILESCLEKGTITECIAFFIQVTPQGEEPDEVILALDRANKTSGEEGVVKWIMELLGGGTVQNYSQPFIYAKGYARLGDKDKAFEYLDKMYEVRAPNMTQIGVEPALDSLRSDPRFDQLLQKIGLE